MSEPTVMDAPTVRDRIAEIQDYLVHLTPNQFGVDDAFRLIDYMSSRYPETIRRMSKLKFQTFIKHRTVQSKEGFISTLENILLDVLQTSSDSWQQRNICEVISSHSNTELICKMLAIVTTETHISDYTKRRVIPLNQLLIKTSQRPCFKQLREQIIFTNTIFNDGGNGNNGNDYCKQG